MSTERRIEMLRPEAQNVAKVWLARVIAEVWADTRIIETLRSLAAQAADAASGASSVKMGWHNVGLAWDFGIFENGKMVNNGDDPRYAKAGAIAVELGCKYPIHLANGRPDADHVEYHPGFTLQHLLDSVKQGIT